MKSISVFRVEDDSAFLCTSQVAMTSTEVYIPGLKQVVYLNGKTAASRRFMHGFLFACLFVCFFVCFNFRIISLL